MNRSHLAIGAQLMNAFALLYLTLVTVTSVLFLFESLSGARRHPS